MQITNVLRHQVKKTVNFDTLPTSITFAEGQTVFIEELDPLEDDIVEGDETVVITLLDSDDYAPDPNELTTTLTIKDGIVTPTAPFSITSVTTVSCITVTASERRLTFTPQYAGNNGSPISFSVVNELLPTTSPGPYTLRLYTDNPTVTLSAVQSGTVSTFSYYWLSAYTGGTTPPPTPPAGPFSITGATTVRCEVVSAGERQLTFTPTYAGQDGSPVSFSVVNELLPTTGPGPYSLRIYTDNPVITLSAEQRGVVSQFSYRWLDACNANARPAAEQDGTLAVTVLGNPLDGNQLEVEVRGAEGQPLYLFLSDEHGRLLAYWCC